MDKPKTKRRKKEKPQRFDPFILIDLALNVWIAFMFFQTWSTPFGTDIDRVYTLSTMIVFEFVMIHSGILMSAFPLKFTLFIFFPFYGLFAFVFNMSVSDNTILYLYLVVVLNRMRFAFYNVDQETKRRNIRMSVYALCIYIFIFLTVASSPKIVPELGLTHEFLKIMGYQPHGTGILNDEPKISMCIGFLYYIALALFDMIVFGNSLISLIKRQISVTKYNNRHL